LSWNRWAKEVVGLDESLSGRIFISYRRQETAWPAGRLYDVLVEHFPAEQVFKDVDNIDPGEDFVEQVQAAVASCEVLLALIGPQWLTMTDESGHRRLDNPEDYVRLEIETALKRKIRVIPILVDDARMPRSNELPVTLAPLVRRNAVEINPVTFDTKRLISTVRRTLAALKVSDTTTPSASPTPTASPDRSDQEVAGPEVEHLYDQALASFWTEQWDKAVDLFGEVLTREPYYADAARKLELARRQQQLALHYTQASAAADAGDWEQAVAEYSMVADSEPDYRETNARLAKARHQHQLAGWLAEAHRLHRARQWAAVIKVGEQLRAIEPSAADPDGLIASARSELAAEQRAANLAADYHTALRLFDAGRWEEAVGALERVTQLDPTYQNAPALLDRARRELGQASIEQAEAPRQALDKSSQASDPIPLGPPTQSQQEQLTRRSQTPKTGAADSPKQRRKSFLNTVLPAILLAILISVAISVPLIIEHNMSPPNGQLVFNDDFSSPAFWPLNVRDAGGATYYLSSAYRVRAGAHYSKWAWPDQPNVYPRADSNLRIDVEARAVNGADQGGYGIACRLKGNNFYAFEINENGHVAIRKVSDAGGWAYLASSSTSLVSNNGTRKLQATCSSPQGEESKEVDLALWVAGKKVLDTKDTSNLLADGTVALFAASFSNGAIEAQFDNFSVTRI
jgi:tetratricopeptide (TPR) repeat protein